jgi:redox-sensitive bicupin YhaK (pirin superfamily)
VQIWLALPDENEDDAPSFEHHPEATLPAVAPAAGARGRLLAGAAFGEVSPLRHPGRPLLVDLELEPGAVVELPDAPERGVFVIDGELHLGPQVLGRDRLAVVAPGARACISAAAQSRVLVLGGPPMSPRLMDWNFVASSRERLVRARDDWKARRFPVIPTDVDDFVPYPELHR